MERAHGWRGAASPLLGLHYATVGRLACAAGRLEEGARAYERAVSMLQLTHGRGHALVGECAQSLREAQAEVAHAAAGRDDDE